MFYQPIIRRMRKRARLLGFTPDKPSITVIVRPKGLDTLPSSDLTPLIKTSELYELYYHRHTITRVVGGICYTRESEDAIYTITEVNEYGIVYCQTHLISSGENNDIDHSTLIYKISDTLDVASTFYSKCEHSDVVVHAHIKGVFKHVLTNCRERKLVKHGQRSLSLDSNIKASKECLTNDLHEKDEKNNIVLELVKELLWAFNVPVNNENIVNSLKNYL